MVAKGQRSDQVLRANYRKTASHTPPTSTATNTRPPANVAHPVARLTLAFRPDLLTGIPVARERLRLARVTPAARFHENLRGMLPLLRVRLTAPSAFGEGLPDWERATYLPAGS